MDNKSKNKLTSPSPNISDGVSNKKTKISSGMRAYWDRKKERKIGKLTDILGLTVETSDTILINPSGDNDGLYVIGVERYKSNGDVNYVSEIGCRVTYDEAIIIGKWLLSTRYLFSHY